MPLFPCTAGCAAIIVASLCIGCTKNPPMGQVRGEIVFDGKPIPAGHEVCFEMSSRGYLAAGEVQEGGKYMLSYRRSEDVPLGDYVVFVTPPNSGMTEKEFRALKKKVDAEFRSRGKQPPISPDWVLPERYYQPSTSPLRATVKEGENVINLTLDE